MKKLFKIFGFTLLGIFLLLLAVPLLFQNKIEDILKNYINKNVNAQVEFSDVGLNFINSFPQAQLSVSDLSITNFKPFEGETLLTSKAIKLTMPVKEVFKSAEDGPLTINSITIDEALVTLKTDKFGNTNYDIAKDSEEDDTSTSSATNTDDDSFAFDIEDYSIKNSAFTYQDENGGTDFHITEFNHEGNGTFSAEISELDTHTDGYVSLVSDSTEYLSNNHIKLDALIGLDLENSVYTFKENKGFINQLPLEFKGYLKQLDDAQELNISFENPSSSFKDFLAVVPKEYAKNLDDVETNGDFKMTGVLKGKITDKTIPTIDINITSNNASFKYPDLPKRAENIVINASVKNTTGKSDDTYIDIKTLNFKIDEDVFNSSATLKNLTENMLVNAHVDGKLDLSKISKVYPIEMDKQMSGILRADLNTNFDMNALETNAYNRIKTTGNMQVSDFVFSSEEVVNPIHIYQANMDFSPQIVTLKDFKAQSGNSDLNATGTMKNVIGFLLSDGKVQGDFNVTSNNFAVSDFMVEDETAEKATTTAKGEALKIPEFLDCTINANAKNVTYDNLNLKNVTGTLVIKDQQAVFKDLKSDVFDGKMAVNGTVSTQQQTPTFDLDLGAQDFDVSKSFQGFELFQNIAPIATLLQGKLNTNLKLSGNLDEEFSPQLTSFKGNALVELLTSTFQPQSDKLVGKLTQSLNFVDFSKLDLKDLKTAIDFSDGKVNVKPFHITYKDVDMEVSGAHGFDKNLEYNIVMEVPAKYLGSEVNRLIGKIDDPEVNKLTIPVTALVQGHFKNPTVKTDLKSGVTTLTKKLIEIEKQKALNTGKDKVKDLLGDVMGGNQAQTDSTKTATDSTQNQQPQEQVEDAVKDVLGGIFGKEEKDDE